MQRRRSDGTNRQSDVAAKERCPARYKEAVQGQSVPTAQKIKPFAARARRLDRFGTV